MGKNKVTLIYLKLKLMPLTKKQQEQDMVDFQLAFAIITIASVIASLLL